MLQEAAEYTENVIITSEQANQIEKKIRRPAYLPVRPEVRSETIPLVVGVVALVPVPLREHLHAVTFGAVVSPLTLVAIAVLVNVNSISLEHMRGKDEHDVS